MVDFITELKTADPNVYALSSVQITESVDWLADAKGRLDEVLDHFDANRNEAQHFPLVFMSYDLASAWKSVNMCRINTEAVLYIEELLQPAMGLIVDAKCMCDHLAARSMGMTISAFNSIVGCLHNAIQAICMVTEELISWFGLDSTASEEI